jgi:hypothetical protein
LTPDGVLEIPVRSGNGTESKLAPQNTVQNQEAKDKALRDAQESARVSGAPKAVPGHEGMMEDQALPAGTPVPPPPPTGLPPVPATPVTPATK